MIAVDGRIVEITDNSQSFRARLLELTSIDDGASEERKRAEKELELIRLNFDSFTDYDSFRRLHNNVSEEIADACNEVLVTIREIEEQIDKTPSYSFVKRNALRRQLQSAKAVFSQNAQKSLMLLISEREKTQAGYNDKSKAYHDEMRELTQTVDIADREIAQLQRNKRDLELCLSDISSSARINKEFILSIISQPEIVACLTEYERATDNLEKQHQRLADIRKTINQIDEKTEEPFNEDIDFLETCKAEVANLEANVVFFQVFRKEMMTLYKKNKVEYSRINYRHKLFVKLFFCHLFYTRMISVDNYISIDEAQDISVAEYTLLKTIHGDNCVFNLYGDINQSLFPGKSINDWDELSHIIGENVYVLNENYRNTLQITEYCNKEFGAEIYPIGINGKQVSEMNLGQAINWLKKIKMEKTKFRTAIIIHSDSISSRNSLEKLLKYTDVSWYAVDDKKISVLTVENAKGLEFDAVVVLCDGMEINEQYVAYTRPLDNLCIVKNSM